MSDEPLTNTAVEWLRHTFASTAERPTGRVRVTDDFYYEDRQSGVNFGRIDAAGFQEFVSSAWDVGTGRPRWTIRQVIAICGQLSALMTLRLDYGDDTVVDNIACFQLDASAQLMRRLIVFDMDDVDAALAELDRMHAEIDDKTDTPS